jgi:uncharacterized Zn finger protein
MKKWASLTWDHLEEWAGDRSVSRGQTYQRQGRVEEMVIATDGRLLATVMGRERYVVSAWLKAGKKTSNSIQSRCTCPVGVDGCKHAVAVVAEYLDALAKGTPVAAADPEDDRWETLENDSLSGEEGESKYRDDEEAGRELTGGPIRSKWDEKIRRHIDAKSREELVELVSSLTQRFPQLRDEFRERIALSEGNVDRLVAQAKQELRQATSEAGWRNSWTGEGHTPDFSRVKHRLERLVEMGHADAVVQLGREIIERGLRQVGESHDEGETASSLTDCLPVVFQAVAQSKLSPPQRILFAIDACLKDDYGIVDAVTGAVLKAKYQPSDWSAVADELARRLNQSPKERTDDFSRNYHRDRLSGWLVDSLEKAGRQHELLAIYEAEARTTGSYRRLVDFLIEQKRYDDAQRWAAEGIEKTCQKLPGIASNLVKSLCEVARLRERWDIVAAHAAWEFFDQPGRESFNQLVAVATKAGCEEAVRCRALRFLETGISPIRLATTRASDRNDALGNWPLPMPDYLLPMLKVERRNWFGSGPRLDVLIDMAIADKRPDEVLHWYDKLRIDAKEITGGVHRLAGCADHVAEAVARAHPNRSLEIYQHRVTEFLKQADKSAYETVASYLRKMQPIMKSIGSESGWMEMVADIRLNYRNRPRFVEILDKLSRRPIVEAKQNRRPAAVPRPSA